MPENKKSKRCQALVSVKGEMRLRRGYGYYRHYTTRQCSRKAIKDGLCGQHLKVSEWNLERVKS